MLGGVDITPPNSLNPKAIETAVTARMPIRIAPLTFSASSAAITKNPMIASSGAAWVMSPSPMKVASLATTIPAFFSAMMPRNMPMPAATALRIECGIPATSQRRTPVTVRIRKMQPEMNTAPKPCCQVKPIAPTTVKAKNAFSPMPGAIAIGQLA